MTHKHSDILGDNLKINHDIKLAISSDEFKFYFWVNLWHACLDCIAKFIIDNLLEKKKNQSFSFNFENEPNKLNQRYVNKKNYEYDSRNNLDSSKNILYLNNLIERNDICIKKFIHSEDEKKNEVSEENNENKNRNNFFNSKSKIFYYFLITK